ncbi:unnamed protein product [Closterium sp. Yama58-4]|nr:unnamed protein product [Closterium sp. Yama58-4]
MQLPATPLLDPVQSRSVSPAPYPTCSALLLCTRGCPRPRALYPTCSALLLCTRGCPRPRALYPTCSALLLCTRGCPRPRALYPTCSALLLCTRGCPRPRALYPTCSALLLCTRGCPRPRALYPTCSALLLCTRGCPRPRALYPTCSALLLCTRGCPRPRALYPTCSALLLCTRGCPRPRALYPTCSALLLCTRGCPRPRALYPTCSALLLCTRDQWRHHAAERILEAELGEMEGGRRVLVDTGVKFGLSAPPLNSGPSMATVNMSFYRWESVTPPPVVDWRKTVAMTAIQTQFVCSSCWAIAAVDSIAIMWAIANNATGTNLSPQQVCDCATKQCCQGGWPEWAFSYVLFNGGITSNASYPYFAVDSATCLLDTTMPTVANITGWELVPAFNAMALMKAVSMQPVVAFISASASDFTTYASHDVLNIYNGVCSTDVNHAVVVVGFNYTGPDLKGSYWIIKNSWLSTWGDRGYMYLAMTPDVRGKCGILSYVPRRHAFHRAPAREMRASLASALAIPPVASVPLPKGSPLMPGNPPILFLLSPIPRFLRRTPAMYPVYFPSSQQPARFYSDKRGRWKIDREDDLSSLFSSSLSLPTNTTTPSQTPLATTCAGMINPCGGGSCYMSGGVPRCNCGALANFVEVLGLPTSKCVPRSPCTTAPVNPCNGGTCTDVGDGTYTCACTAGYAVGAAVDGSPTCIPAAGLAKSYTTINCTGWYRVMQGDTCPSIWNAANLTMSMFLTINPGIQCQAPYLVVGQQVCIDSPLLTTMQRNPNANYSIYTVRPNDTLSTISTQYLTRCTLLSVSPAAIAAQNFISNASAPLPVGTNLIIPCIGGIGMIDGGCATSLTVCGADFVSYPSYCHAAVNYGLSLFENSPCDNCGAACVGRMGLAPASGFGCTQAICPYPTWMSGADCTLGDNNNGTAPCCYYRKTLCQRSCNATAETMGGTTTTKTNNYNTCWNNCMCCAAAPCGGPACTTWNDACYTKPSPRFCTYTMGVGYTFICSYYPAANPLP